MEKKTTADMSRAVGEQILSCPICFERYSTEGDRLPKVLNCLHSSCQGCLRGLARQCGNRTILCPTCRQVTELPNNDGDVESLRVNFIAINLLDIISQHAGTRQGAAKTTSNPGDLLCAFCEEEGAEVAHYGCVDCSTLLCIKCKPTHDKVKLFKGHTVLLLAEYSSRIGEQKKAVTVKCRKHRMEDIRFCCEDCHDLACQTCFDHEHSGHR